MSDYEQAVFISYAWGEENEKIVNQLDQSLQGRGMKVIRDKRDLEYTGSIRSFMERIGTGDCVIVVISDKYLKSPNCMFELVEIAGNKQFEKRIFPLVLADAEIYKIKGKFQYIKHWENQIKELKELLKEVDPTNLQDIYEQLNLYDRIRDNISRLTGILSDMNALTPEMHKDSDFNQLYTAIEKRMKESPAILIPRLYVAEDRIKIQEFEPETILIPEGSFWMGSDPGEGIPIYETPRHEVTLPNYRIGKYLVTNAQYQVFIDKTKTLVTRSMRWLGQMVPEGQDEVPVTGVTWYEALAYCRWLSNETERTYQLPNEAQWEKACRGGNNYFYPWGDEFDSTRCNHGNSEVAPVDPAKPAQNDYGGYDFVGNIRQWTCSLWGEKHPAPEPKYAYPWKNDRRNDVDANNQIRRVIRGSSFKEEKRDLRCSIRNGQAPEQAIWRDVGIGFRVVMIV